MTLIELAAERGRIRLHLRCLRIGEDLCVTLSGGDREHVGAVALARPGTEAGVLPVPGHREDELARRTAARLAEAQGVAVCVACGIHVDKLRPEELADVLQLSAELTERLLERLAR